ncbi:flagellar filament capping protein FliD [Lachnospiraceae bacterium ZAX-1]
MASIDSVYNYYLSTYSHQAVTRYDTHNKSELRNVYNKIVKLNKESPFYKIKDEADVAKFAIDIKEGAKNIQNIVSSLSGYDDIMKAFQKKIAISSDEAIAAANYVGQSDDSPSAEEFNLEVKQLAKPQINIGNFIKGSHHSLDPGSYTFGLTNTANAYEFQFNVNEFDTNYNIQTKLSHLITNANIGLTSSIVEDEQGLSALKLESLTTGLSEQQDFLFKITPDGSLESAQAVQILGLDQISQKAQNSLFLVDGKPLSSYSNTFTIDNVLELTLHGISPEDEPTVIGFKTNSDAIADNIQTLVDSYNTLLQTATQYSGSQQHSAKLLYDMGSSAMAYHNELESIGLLVDDNGFISVDNALLEEAINSENPESHFTALNDFKDILNAKASYASLNPMEYVNKTMIAYKNPGHNFATPYVTSIYSGMMMDRYC